MIEDIVYLFVGLLDAERTVCREWVIRDDETYCQKAAVVGGNAK